MGNQQTTSHQLAWLAGIWDGEGTFQIYQNGKHFFIGRLTLTNSSPEMIDEISKILDAHDIGAHLWLEELRTNKHKRCYHLTVNKLSSVKRGTELMLPYLIAKKAHANILLRFVDSRLKYKRIANRNPTTGKIAGVQAQGYSDEEKSLCAQLQLLNRAGIKEGVSETTRQTHEDGMI